MANDNIFPKLRRKRHRQSSLYKTTAYSLVRSNAIKHVRIGKKYIIPKQSVIGFLNANCYNGEKIISGGMTVIEIWDFSPKQKAHLTFALS